MPCSLFIPLPTARKPYWRQSGWTEDICERNERETSPPRPVPSSSISAQAEQGWQASPVGPGAGSITGTFLLKGDRHLGDVYWLSPSHTARLGGCAVETLGEEMWSKWQKPWRLTKAIWAKDFTEGATRQRMQACHRVKREGRAAGLEPAPGQLWKLGFHQEDVWMKHFCQPPRGLSRGAPRASGSFC